MTIQIPTKVQIFLRSLATVAISGAVTGATPILQSYVDSGSFNHIDWHKVGQVALAGAAMAIYYHFKPSLTAPIVKSDTPPPAA